MIQIVWICIFMFNYFLNYKITSLKRTSCLSCPMECPYVIGIAMQISLDTGESSQGSNLTWLLRASPGASHMEAHLNGGFQFTIRDSRPWTIVGNVFGSYKRLNVLSYSTLHTCSVVVKSHWPGFPIPSLISI